MIDRDALISAGVKLGWWIANRYGGRDGDPYRADLGQEAFLAIHKAAHYYDPTRSTWTTFVVLAVRQRLGMQLNKMRSAVSIPLNSSSRGISVRVKADPLVTFDGDEIDPVDLLATSTPGPDAALLETEIATTIRDAVSHLPPRERTVLHLRYLGPERRTIPEVGARIGTTRQAVQQMEMRAFNKLRRSPALRELRP